MTLLLIRLSQHQASLLKMRTQASCKESFGLSIQLIDQVCKALRAVQTVGRRRACMRTQQPCFAAGGACVCVSTNKTAGPYLHLDTIPSFSSFLCCHAHVQMMPTFGTCVGPAHACMMSRLSTDIQYIMGLVEISLAPHVVGGQMWQPRRFCQLISRSWPYVCHNAIRVCSSFSLTVCCHRGAWRLLLRNKISSSSAVARFLN